MLEEECDSGVRANVLGGSNGKWHIASLLGRNSRQLL